MFKTIITTILLTIAASTVSAYEVHKNICLKYKNTGATYTIDAHQYTGSELNEATSTFNYWAFSDYIVIFWADGTTIIEADGPFESVTGILGFDGKDQRGYKWNVHDTSFCF